MRTTLILVLALAVLGGIYFLFFFDREESSLCREAVEFAVDDTAAVQRIELERVFKGETTGRITLERLPDGDWQLNGDQRAVVPYVRNLLETLHLVRVRRTLNEASRQAAAQLLEVDRIQVSIYDDKKEIKSYQVGLQTRDFRGTVMRIDEEMPMFCEAHPQVVHLPGLEGYLNTRYTVDTSVWRENLLFNARPKDLARIEVNYPDKARSFTLENRNSAWTLAGGERPLDTEALNAYLNQFNGKVYGETFAGRYFPNLLDSLKSGPADIHYTLGFRDGRSRSLHLYARDDNPNNYFGYIEGEDELITVQRFSFDKFLRSRGDFLK